MLSPTLESMSCFYKYKVSVSVILALYLLGMELIPPFIRVSQYIVSR